MTRTYQDNSIERQIVANVSARRSSLPARPGLVKIDPKRRGSHGESTPMRCCTWFLTVTQTNTVVSHGSSSSMSRTPSTAFCDRKIQTRTTRLPRLTMVPRHATPHIHSPLAVIDSSRSSCLVRQTAIRLGTAKSEALITSPACSKTSR